MNGLLDHPGRVEKPFDTADRRIVLTLDAGGTNFAFSAMRGGRNVGKGCVLPACGDDLDKSLSNLTRGFERLIESLDDRPTAISFAFPGPADYPNGVVFNVGNLPAYREGVAVAALLEDRFGLPVFLNNDGDLFAYGEAVAGILPEINRRLAASGATHRHNTLFAVTLGTGLGGGAVVDGRLLRGENSSAAEIWRLPSGLDGASIAEEDASIRAVRTTYAQESGIDPDSSPTPAEIAEIARGQSAGDPIAAQRAFEKLGRAVGATIATATCLLDGLVVLGGGLTGAADLFMPALMETLGGPLHKRDGSTVPRLPHKAFDLRSDEGIAAFAEASISHVTVPGSTRRVVCTARPRLGVGVSRLGANRATAIGAYAFALQQIDTP